MLSTHHIEFDYDVRNAAKTFANGLKFSYDVTDDGKSFSEHVKIICKMAILERIARGEDVADPYDVNLPLDIADHVPQVLKVFLQSTNMMVTLEHIKYQILDAFREAYLNVLRLYPQLEVKED